MVREIWLVRHGVTALNRQRRIQGHSDTPLSEEGVGQAEALASWLGNRPVLFDGVVSSPLERAHHTARILARELGLAIHLDSDLMETSFGEWEGMDFETVNGLREKVGGEPFAVVAPDGESPQIMAERVSRAFDRWTKKDDVRHGRILAVTHGGPIASQVCRTLGVDFTLQNSRRFRRDNTAVFVWRRPRSDPSTFTLASLNETSHLDAFSRSRKESP